MEKESNYKTFTRKIRQANTITNLKKLEKSLTNLYNNGIFTSNELMKLDTLIMDKLQTYENKSNNRTSKRLMVN